MSDSPTSFLKRSYFFLRNAIERRTHTEHFIVADKTRHEVLFSDGLMELRYYPHQDVQPFELDGDAVSPQTQQHRTPILLVPPLGVFHWIYDLMAERSWVRFLNAKGFQVYLVNWGESGESGLRQVIEQGDWQQVNESIPNYGHAMDPFWFKLDIQASQIVRTWALVISNPLIDYLDVYGVNAEGERVSHYSGGAQRKQSEQDIRHRYPVIPIELGKLSSLTYYVRVESSHSVQLPLAVWPLQDFAARNERDSIITGVLLGALFIMLLYNLFLYTTLRDPIYLAYVGSVFGFMMLQVSVKGFGLRFLWPDQFAVSSVAVFASGFVTIFFATTFASWFMRLKERGFRFMLLVDFSRWGGVGLRVFGQRHSGCLAAIPDGVSGGAAYYPGFCCNFHLLPNR